MRKDIGKGKLKEVFSKKNISAFINKFGFYLILLVCLGIVAATAFLTQGNRQKNIDGKKAAEERTPSNLAAGDETGEMDTSNEIDISITDVIDPEPSGESPLETPSTNKNTKISNTNTKDPGSNQEEFTEKDKGLSDDKNESSAQSDKSDKGSEAQTVSAPGKGKVSGSGKSKESPSAMSMPVNGEVTEPYSVDALVYSQTLKEWTTHTGIDIAGNVGGEVKAALSGTVESIEEDPLKGIVITLDHGGGLKTVYMGLSTPDMVREGQKVEKGQVISGIGRTAAFEITEDPHLHFEVVLDGQQQNPQEYLEEK